MSEQIPMEFEHEDQRRRWEALRRLQTLDPLVLGQIVYFLTAERCEGCEDAQFPLVDPRSFAWSTGVVVELESVRDGVLCARVRDEHGDGLYERRYIVTEEEREKLGIPVPP
jgi:hypothetical protein